MQDAKPQVVNWTMSCGSSDLEIGFILQFIAVSSRAEEASDLSQAEVVHGFMNVNNFIDCSETAARFKINLWHGFKRDF